MAETSIEWTDTTWNPVRGCSRVSPGCDNCYAMRVAHRFSGPGKTYEGLTRIGKRGVDWSGRVRLVPEMLDAPLRWRKPRRVFVNSMSDLFHESLSNEDIDAVFGVMWACLYNTQAHPGHVFQVLTKRARRMRDYMTGEGLPERWARAAGFRTENGDAILDQTFVEARKGPHPRIWLGVSAEDQQRADERIPDLLATPAAVRGVSLEPLLGPVDLWAFLDTPLRNESLAALRANEPHPIPRMPGISWVIVGSESGPGARPMRIEWAESLRDQCAAAGVPFFTKQIATERDRKGGNPEHWPGGPWPRQWPGRHEGEGAEQCKNDL